MINYLINFANAYPVSMFCTVMMLAIGLILANSKERA